jgi:hypothetical protein
MYSSSSFILSHISSDKSLRFQTTTSTKTGGVNVCEINKLMTEEEVLWISSHDVKLALTFATTLDAQQALLNLQTILYELTPNCIVSGGGSGDVVSVVAGDNINIDNTDPANPIVNGENGIKYVIPVSTTETIKTNRQYLISEKLIVDGVVNIENNGQLVLTDNGILDTSGGGIVNNTSGGLIIFQNNELPIAPSTGHKYWAEDKTFKTLDRTAVGLSNVDNTSDINKPVSTAQAAADAVVLASANTYTNSILDLVISTPTYSANDYTLVLSDKDKLLQLDNGGTAGTLTIPLNSSINFPVGAQILLVQQGNGQITVTPTGGVTLIGAGGKNKLTEDGSGATLVQVTIDTWRIFGDITT